MTPWVAAFTPEMMAVWLGQVTVGLIGVIDSADAPSAIRRRSTGNGTAGSRRVWAAKPSRLITITWRFLSAPVRQAARVRRRNRRLIAYMLPFSPWEAS